MSPNGFTLADVRERTYKPRDSWWTVFLVDPLASRLVKFVANRTRITPDHLTAGALVLGCAAALSFGRGDALGLVIGAAVFHVSFLLDCMDGKIARLKGSGTVFGSWLDYVFDRVRVLICAIGLMGGQYAASGDPLFLWFALAVVFTDMFRYLNAPQLAKVRTTMRREQHERVAFALTVLEESDLVRALGKRRFGELRPRPDEEDLPDEEDRPDAVRPEGNRPEDARPDAVQPVAADQEHRPAPGDERAAEGTSASAPAAAVTGSLSERFPAYGRLRAFLVRHRVRPHLFSGIEFQMGVFIAAPLAGLYSPAAMLATIAASCVGLLLFEAFIVFRLWQAARRYEREKAVIEKVVAAAPSPPRAPLSPAGAH